MTELFCFAPLLFSYYREGWNVLTVPSGVI